MGRILSPIVLLVLACASLYFLPVGMRALGNPGEAHWAEIARYGCPTFGLLTLWLTYRWGENWKNERVGLLAAGLCGTSLGFFGFTQYASIDMLVTFWTTLTLSCGSGLLVERSAGRARRLTYGVALGLAGGLMTRGPVTMLLPVMALLTAYWVQGSRVPVVKRPWKAAIALGALLTVPWFLVIYKKAPALLLSLFIQEPVINQPFYFYIPVFLAAFFPWIAFLPRLIRTWLGHDYAALQRDPEGSVMVAWIGLVIVFFSMFPTKFLGSIVPVLPALALLLANEFDEVLEEESLPTQPMPSWVGYGIILLIGCLFLTLIAIKLPLHVWGNPYPEWKALWDQSALIGLVLGFGIFVLVGVWGMRQTLVSIGGIMLIQVLLLTSVVSLIPAVGVWYP